MAANRIYPIFLSHVGCPFRCVYCDQNSVVSSRAEEWVAVPLLDCFESDFTTVLAEAASSGVPGQLAFYGGTFTAISIKELRFILDKVSPYIESGVFTGVRFSTRPDCMGKNVCSVLADYPIQTVELGVQALCDEVLDSSRRGYSSEQVRQAAEAVRRFGWELGFQLMPGLPGDSREKFRETVSRAIAMKPDFVRLYPTVVLKNTVLAGWHYEKTYRPLSLEDAIEWCTEAYEQFQKNNIRVVRMGLHSDPALQAPGTIVAGPYHPAFGYLVKVHWWCRQVDLVVAGEEGSTEGKTLTVRVPKRRLSEASGPRRANITHWLERWRFDKVQVIGESALAGNHFEVQCI
ncbi:MAG: radical SAM protein [Desulfoferrobacter sp.]